MKYIPRELPCSVVNCPDNSAGAVFAFDGERLFSCANHFQEILLVQGLRSNEVIAGRSQRCDHR